MKIGIVVPLEIIEDITSFVTKEFPEIEPIPFPYQNIMDIPAILSGQQCKAEAMLFLGETARRYAEKAVPSNAQWITIPRSTASLLRLLFRAKVDGYGMHIATDSGNSTLFRLAFKEIGLTDEEAYVTSISFSPYTETILLKDANQMEMLYRSGKVDFCITIFYQVLHMLRARGVPAYILQPSFDDIRSALQRLILAYELQLSQNSQLAVIAIKAIHQLEKLPGADSYDLALERLAVTQRIYKFARTLQAAFVERPPSHYLLFSTKASIETVTDHFHRLPLLEQIKAETAFILSMGFGYGQTANEAAIHAEKALRQAETAGDNRAYLMGKELFTRVPMAKEDQEAQETEMRSVDSRYLDLSQKTGISLRLLSRLSRACRDTGRRRFTSAELADLTGVTPRTMNRILTKLLDAHVAQDVGRQFLKQTGRPSRVIELLLQD